MGIITLKMPPSAFPFVKKYTDIGDRPRFIKYLSKTLYRDGNAQPKQRHPNRDAMTSWRAGGCHRGKVESDRPVSPGRFECAETVPPVNKSGFGLIRAAAC